MKIYSASVLIDFNSRQILRPEMNTEAGIDSMDHFMHVLKQNAIKTIRQSLFDSAYVSINALAQEVDNEGVFVSQEYTDTYEFMYNV